MSGPPPGFAGAPGRRRGESFRRGGKVEVDGSRPKMVAVRRLGTFSDADGVSQLLFRLSVTSTVFCLSEMSAPWGFEVAARPSPAFHLLTAGSAWLEVESRPGAVRLLAGDLVIL